ncbi:MAG: cytochrome C [Nitrospirota bacterium]|nr:cytochrome C [Nitrospirota bacterium]
MNPGHKIILTVFFCFLMIVAAAAQPDNKFKLKSGAKGKLCLNCHTAFQDKMKSTYLHTPVKGGECSGCHNPHSSSHGKLLDADTDKICFKCHGALVAGKARSIHKIAGEGQCVLCHDPHGSNNKNNLLTAGNELCFTCHSELGERVKKAQFKHSPVERGCISCHNPHASEKSDFLLETGMPDLCVKCHKTDTPSFKSRHMNYPVANARCTTCHTPHGSNKSGLLHENVHMPVANKMCNQCHDEPTSPTPFRTKREGFELCRGCHNEMVGEAFTKNRLHWPLVSREGCLSCHTPHGSLQKGLLNRKVSEICGKCHADTIARHEKAAVKHNPVKEGNCTYCHSPHASDNFLLLKQPVIELCGTCHEWQKHTTHPIGEKYIDPRNKNLNVQCLSCHRSHGTDYKNMIYFDPVSVMCTQCHKDFTR